MEDNKNIENKQTEDKTTHIVLPRSLKIRLDKIKRETGRSLLNVNIEIVRAGLDAYYKKGQTVA